MWSTLIPCQLGMLLVLVTCRDQVVSVDRSRLFTVYLLDDRKILLADYDGYSS